MNIAYIFFGQVKNFDDRQFYSVQQNILNQLTGHDIDFFLTTSINDTYFNIRNKQTEDTKKDIDYKSINKFFDFKECFYDNANNYPEQEICDLAETLLSSGESWTEGSALNSTINSLKQLYGLNYFYNHFLQHIDYYDYFIFSRSDLYHVSPIDLNFINEDKDIWIPFWNNIPQIDYGNFGGLNDRFAVIKTKKTLELYCTRYNKILKSPQAYHAETYLKQILDSQNIKYGKINNFLFEMMRAGGVISDLVGTSKDENMNKNLNNISNCFYINLDRREDRRNHFITNTPFFAQRFSAVDAKSAELNEEIKKLFPKTWNSRKKSEICCALSHYKLWKKLIEDNSSKNYLILEDDVVFKKGFAEFWNEVFSEFVPNSYNLIYLGGCQPWNKPKYHEAVKRHNDYFYNVKKNDFFSKGDHFWHMTTCSYIISKQAANLMCQHIDQFGMDQALDFFMLRFFDNNKFFSAPDSVFHLNPLMARQLHEENDNTAIDEKSDIRYDESVFEDIKYHQLLDKRKNSFLKSLEIIKKQASKKSIFNIVELGTSRSFISGYIEQDANKWNKHNPQGWDWGAGCFTKFFAENLKQYKNITIHSVDPCPKAINVSSKICEDNDNVKLYQLKAEDFIRKIDFKIDFLYMDHMESGEESCIVHLNDIKYLIENQKLSSDCAVLHDDVNNNAPISKSKYSIPFLKDNGYKEIISEYQSLMTPNNNRVIPKIIHQTWKDDHLKKDLENLWTSKNPNYKYNFYNDNDIEKIIKENFDQRIYKCYKRLIAGAAKADFFRYCIIYLEGGIYCDIDFIPHVGFDDFISKELEIVVCDDQYGLFNAFIASKPKHDFFLSLIDKICNQIDSGLFRNGGFDIVSLCGCGILRDHFVEHFTKNKSPQNKRLILHHNTSTENKDFIELNGKKLIDCQANFQCQKEQFNNNEHYTKIDYLYTEADFNITKIIHQSWKTKDIPYSVYKKEWIDSWKQKNPDWEYKFWTDEDNRNLVEKYYPQYLELYDSYERPIAKADISRFFYLHKYGGLYVDLDFMCLKSLDQVIDGEKINLGRQKMKNELLAQNSVPNALMYSPPGDIFWIQCIEELKHHKHNQDGSLKGTEHATGPIFLGKCIDKFKPKNLLIHNETTFYPISWELSGSSYNGTIKKEWLDNPKSEFPNSFAVTYWSGNWRKNLKENKRKMIILSDNLFEEDFIDELFEGIEYEKAFDPKMETIQDGSIIVYSDIYAKNVDIYPEKYRQFFRDRFNQLQEYFAKCKNCILIHLSDEHCHAHIDHYKNFKHVFRQYYRGDAVADNVTFIPLGHKKGFC